MSIFVGNLPFRAEREDVLQLFAPFGEVLNCSLPLERDTGRKRGFAFVEMADEAIEATAIDGLQGTELMGRPLRINKAEPRGSGGPRRGGRGGQGAYLYMETLTDIDGDFSSLAFTLGQEFVGYRTSMFDIRMGKIDSLMYEWIGAKNEQMLYAGNIAIVPTDNTDVSNMLRLTTRFGKTMVAADIQLEDDNHVILALQNAEKVNKWDLAAEYVNNNLLSSPDTHILNIASGLMQTQWKPMVMLVRSAYMMPVDRARAGVIAGEAIDTYVYQYVYTVDI